MSLKERLVTDMNKALRNRDTLTLSVIRLARASIKNREIEKGKELDDEEVIEVLASEARRRKEAIEEYQKGNRQDLAEKERKELEILQEYLPQPLSEAEIKQLAHETIREVGALGVKDLGKVMGTLMPKVRGRAEGRIVHQIVRELLEGGGS